MARRFRLRYVPRMLLLLVSLACVHLHDVSAAPGGDAFFVLANNTVLRCTVNTRSTTCTRVLTGLDVTELDGSDAGATTTVPLR